MKTVILLTFTFFIYCTVSAQEIPVTADSASAIRKIEKISQKRKSTRFLYSLIFKPVEARATKPMRKRYGEFNHPPYEIFEKKIIRKIYITTLDPFGYDIDDTLVKPETSVFKTGNSLHLKTLTVTIRNQLLFKKNTPFDSLLVMESEHLVRGQKYVHEVLISPILAGINEDSVDIYVRVIDVWSIEPAISITTINGEAVLNDNNFLGTGHRLSNDVTWKNKTGEAGYTGSYYIPAIMNTYISSSLYFRIDQNKNILKSINIERPFYSSITRWAGGVYLGRQIQKTSDGLTLPDPENSFYKIDQQDYWAGLSWQPLKNISRPVRNMNLTISGRSVRIRFVPKPITIGDTGFFYSNQDFYLAAIGISKREYKREKFVFNYGTIEDVPVGRLISFTGGYQIRNSGGRSFAGVKISWGDFSRWGYISAQFEYGTFIRNAVTEQGIVMGGINYFTDLFLVGRWKFRQFIKQNYTLGINRNSYEKLTLNNGNGLRGFNSSGLWGNERMILSLQSQSYSPLNILGFNFGPYLHSSLGMLGNKNMLFKGSTLYSQFGLGILIKNEFLILGTFQFSFAYYPVVPGKGTNVFLINPFRTADFGLTDFVSGKPDPPLFQ